MKRFLKQVLIFVHNNTIFRNSINISFKYIIIREKLTYNSTFQSLNLNHFSKNLFMAILERKPRTAEIIFPRYFFISFQAECFGKDKNGCPSFVRRNGGRRRKHRGYPFPIGNGVEAAIDCKSGATIGDPDRLLAFHDRLPRNRHLERRVLLSRATAYIPVDKSAR